MKARLFAAGAVCGLFSLVLIGSAGANAAPAQVVSGLGHSCAIVGSNVWCWGDNAYGQLGTGVAGGTSSTPVQVTGLTGVTQISAGTYQTCALRNDQSIWCWGALGPGPVNPQPTPVPSPLLPGTWAAVAAGQFDVCGLTTDRMSLVCAGDSGRTIVGTHGFPLPVATDARGQYMLGLGSYEACAGLTDGTVWCFGDTGFGGPATPALASGPFGGTVTGVTADYFNDACATFSDGSAWCWSDDGASGGFTPEIAPGAGAPGIAAQNGHICALVSGGGATCWTDGGAVPGLSGATQISTSGLGGGCALVGGGIKCWGNNGFGQLGDGTNTPSATPVDVVGFASAPPDTDLALADVPAGITVDATSSAGASVTFTAPTATDEGGETPPVLCDHASGETFPVGTTFVHCSASDADDANSPVSSQFAVTVNTFAPVGCLRAGSVHAEQHWSMTSGKKNDVHVEVDGVCGADKKTGQIVLRNAHLRVTVGSGPPLIDAKGNDGDARKSDIKSVTITSASDASITGTYNGVGFVVTLHDGGKGPKNDTVRVQYGAFDTATLAAAHGDVHIDLK